MLRNILLLAGKTVVLASILSPAICQNAVDPASKVWQVEVNGTVLPGETFVFIPILPGNPAGFWINADDQGTVWGYGYYAWDREAGTINYINASNDGNSNETGTYTWMGTLYKRTSASHPQAPPMSLL